MADQPQQMGGGPPNGEPPNKRPKIESFPVTSDATGKLNYYLYLSIFLFN